MIIVTSLSPFHSNSENQIHAIESWKGHGELFSLNINTEIEQMRLVYENHIHFIKTDKTIKHIVNKNLVTINAIFDFAIKCDRDLFLINSDIIIGDLPELKEDGITIISRFDYKDHFGEAKRFEAGFDGFYIPKKFLNIFPQSIFALGMAFHDYYTPYTALLNGVPVYWPQGQHLFHKLHETQYSIEEWLHIGEHFRWFFKLNKHINIGQMATETLNRIKSKSIK